MDKSKVQTAVANVTAITLFKHRNPNSIDLSGLEQKSRLDAIWAWAMRGMSSSRRSAHIGAGAMRARARTSKKRSANALIPSLDVTTRQRRRRYAILKAKQARAINKQKAATGWPIPRPGRPGMKVIFKPKGGSAVVFA